MCLTVFLTFILVLAFPRETAVPAARKIKGYPALPACPWIAGSFGDTLAEFLLLFILKAFQLVKAEVVSGIVRELNKGFVVKHAPRFQPLVKLLQI